MSASLYRWKPSCDGDYCVGDCDLCSKEDDGEQIREQESQDC